MKKIKTGHVLPEWGKNLPENVRIVLTAIYRIIYRNNRINSFEPPYHSTTVLQF